MLKINHKLHLSILLVISLFFSSSTSANFTKNETYEHYGNSTNNATFMLSNEGVALSCSLNALVGATIGAAFAVSYNSCFRVYIPLSIDFMVHGPYSKNCMVFRWIGLGAVMGGSFGWFIAPYTYIHNNINSTDSNASL